MSIYTLGFIVLVIMPFFVFGSYGLGLLFNEALYKTIVNLYNSRQYVAARRLLAVYEFLTTKRKRA